MANEQNLRPIKLTHEEAKELGTKGGKVKSLAKKLAQRKKCISQCPLWATCWAKHISISQLQKDIKDGKATEKENPNCALKTLPSRIFDRTIRLLEEGENGFNLEIVETLLRLANEIEVDKSPKNMKDYLHQVRECKKAIFGTKSKIEGEIRTPDMSAKDFATAYQKLKEMEK